MPKPFFESFSHCYPAVQGGLLASWILWQGYGLLVSQILSSTATGKNIGESGEAQAMLDEVVWTHELTPRWHPSLCLKDGRVLLMTTMTSSLRPLEALNRPERLMQAFRHSLSTFGNKTFIQVMFSRIKIDEGYDWCCLSLRDWWSK